MEGRSSASAQRILSAPDSGSPFWEPSRPPWAPSTSWDATEPYRHDHNVAEERSNSGLLARAYVIHSTRTHEGLSSLEEPAGGPEDLQVSLNDLVDQCRPISTRRAARS